MDGTNSNIPTWGSGPGGDNYYGYVLTIAFLVTLPQTVASFAFANLAFCGLAIYI